MGPELGCSSIVIGKPGSQSIGRLGSLAERTTPTWLASSFSADAWRSDSVFIVFLTALNQGQFCTEWNQQPKQCPQRPAESQLAEMRVLHPAAMPCWT